MQDKVLKEDLEYIIENQQDKLDPLRNKRILITGATGLIGSQIVKTLLMFNDICNARIEIIGIARNKEKTATVFPDWHSRKDFKMVFADISDEINCEKEIDFIVHGANTTSSKEYVNKPVETALAIINGTNNILQFAINHNVKSMVYLSSMEVYGTPDQQNSYMRENMAGYINTLNVRSSYSEGKRMAENLCACYCQEYNVPVKIARLAQVFGTGVSLKDNRVFMQFAMSVINHKNIVLHTSGDSYGNYCYTRDAVSAILLLLEKGINGEAYNVVNEATNIKIKEMADLVADKIANGEISVICDVPDSAMKYGYAPDVTLKLSAEKMSKLGWKSEVGLEEMYRRMIQSLLYRMV
ncbi:NAD-dependent epimerase/dehydratase family protein [Desulfitobacterium hafniense]|uniref:NAD-dependent epimerase/dehydratase family protein n=1 Tax=Desulfitobacterium hafniense TaxID=49338 RepID=UPI000375BDAF|nr:NAD-dependent epimerase/dehydratase family protein [Desulfitobacterium hafniense]